ncbi:hypothetical protein [Sulfitobacter geojensis]|uniref:Uncharacterized protein n=1 Tax=Sulfitobacter geojensis TaxID=1342299 RepID=A0AAE3B6K9_9RHOB|nr:hypothetical protein [Sulfitobacter geojensis]MBM1689284.1 hypothetical protein [Sulfitobacter geojensis]MBM1693350.1 hypothetical protein [Sulfitobacter geojensis]MBM1705516.1 hypothetical protein [Sulfitobacter geojensis]MBM1709574.1 hypothetical protein [Sulfitobacter geojensis]MBM1713640.1 hypothetical protein [Sulfitobacter geojensis]
MEPIEPNLWEDENYVYVPEEMFRLLPPEFREAVADRKQEGEDLLKVVDKDLHGLIRLANAIPTSSSLSYIFHRLRKTAAELTADSLMEQEVLTTAFIVTYSRLFASGKGALRLEQSDIPEHLRAVHDDIIELRNERYAHNEKHLTTRSGINVDFDDDGFHINMQMTLGMYIGGRNEWAELVQFIDAHMHSRLTKILQRLKKKTGYEWSFPENPPPAWVGDYS